MKYLSAAFAFGFSLFAWAPVASAAEVVHTENVGVNIDGRLQVLGHMERVEDSFRDQNRAYMFLRQARIGASGNVDDLRYKFLLGFGGEEEVKAPNPGVSLGLLDMYVDVPMKFAGDSSYLRVGQYKAPFGLERLTDSGDVPFADRSIQNLALRIGRDMGIAFHTRQGLFVGAAGVFTGGGRGVPERYLPEVLGIPLLSARIGLDNGLYENAFAERYAEQKEGLRYSVGLNGLYTKDSKVGHSTVLNVRQGDRSLLINPNWNPYLAAQPLEPGELMQVGADASVRVPAGPGAVTGEIELSYGKYANALGDIETLTGRAQAGYSLDRFDAFLRYAVVKPDAEMAFAGQQVTGGQAFQEITPALSVRLWNKGTKLVADLPVQLNVPVAVEPNVGSYVLSSQPDQTSVLKQEGHIERQNVIAGRLMFQASF